jgi:CubicO group peptidase (beta-lactamase class C family)
MSTQRAALVLALLLPSLPAAAADPPAAKVDAVFAAFAKPGSPGCALAVYKAGKIAYLKGYGVANLEHGVAITPRTIFYIGSVSKQITAAAVALLAKQGKLSLDDDVRKHVPEVPDFGSPITIRHLIHHTSGLREKWVLLQLAGWRGADLVTQKDVLDLVRRQKALNFKPGDEQSYSNTGYDLLAVIVERASGKPLREYARENLFDPLGMKDTRFSDDHTAIIPRRATGYSPKEGGGFAIDMPNVDTVGSGGVYTTVEDLARWDENFYTAKVGGKEWIEQLQTPGTLNSGAKHDYAFGLGVDQDRGLRRVWHNGGLAGYVSTYHRYPGEHFSVVTLCNTTSAEPDQLARQVTDLYLAGRFTPDPPAPSSQTVAEAPKVALSAQDLARIAGTYLEEPTATVRRILVRDGKLIYQRTPENESELAPLSADRFAMLSRPVAVEVVFEPAGAAAPKKMIVKVEGQPPAVFEAVQPPVATPEALAGYAGTFYSDELDATWTFTVHDGRLFFQRRRFGEETALDPAAADTFTAGGVLLIRFTRGAENAEKQVTGLSVTTAQARKIQFVKRAAT